MSGFLLPDNALLVLRSKGKRGRIHLTYDDTGGAPVPYCNNRQGQTLPFPPPDWMKRLCLQCRKSFERSMRKEGITLASFRFDPQKAREAIRD